MGDADVLRFIDDRCVECRGSVGLSVREGLKDGRFGHQAASLQARSHLLEDCPQHRAPRFRKPRATAEPLDIAVRLPRYKLPRIDNLIPLGPKEQRRELVITSCLGSFSKQRVDVLA